MVKRETSPVKSKPEAPTYVLRLFITGMTPRSRTAIKNVQSLMEEYLPGQYELEIIDIYQQPELAKKEQLIAAPTLIKNLPLPLRRLIGDMSQPDRILAALAIKPSPEEEETRG
jgi:circadian clock protein KaiB